MEQQDRTGWALHSRLLIESLRRQLPQSTRTDELLTQLQRFRDTLDATIYALSVQHLDDARRQHLDRMLARQQRALKECLHQLGLREREDPSDPLWHFNKLEPLTRSHLAGILGVPIEPPFYPVLEAKAQEYLTQEQAFEALAEHEGFRRCKRFARSTNRGALILTLSGSLVQVSEPDTNDTRRYLYQNIYGNTHPPSGTLVLDHEIEIGQRLRSLELTTSPVRLVRVPDRPMSWRAQSQTFQRMSIRLSSLASCATGEVELPTGPPRPEPEPTGTDLQFQQIYADDLTRFSCLRQGFIAGGATIEDEAEILALCHYLQRAARSMGYNACRIAQVRGLLTEGGWQYRIDATDPAHIVRIDPLRKERCALLGLSVGRQIVTSGAPLAFISEAGKLVEITRPIASFWLER
jgi:hypothetical protein